MKGKSKFEYVTLEGRTKQDKYMDKRLKINGVKEK